MAQEVKHFVDTLRERLDVLVELWDERLTSVQAIRILQQAGEKPSRNKDRIDRLASALLLQNYLDHRKQASLNSNEEEN